MTRFEFVQSKIKEGAELEKQLAYWRFHNEKIIFTNGCFDLLHPGHIEYLYKAAELGTILVVGLNSDASVSRLKGKQRPIQNQLSRATVLAGLECVDMVAIFEEDTPISLVKQVHPNFLVKGGDYKPEDIVGYQTVKSYGGEILTIPFVEGFSTSSILQKLG
ncbi:MAG: D-glycero-beta-D-manno-heptose 1-phosphate adenylyltransferase [Bacteroidales bacterium]